MTTARRHFFRLRGFTLMEVLVALLIVSLGMLAVIEAVGQAASNSSYLRDKTMAHWVAMNRLTELRLQKQPPAFGESSGEVDMAGQRWRWHTKVSETAVTTISRIDVNVAPADADDEASMANVSGFYGTSVAPQGTLRTAWHVALPSTEPPGGNPNTPPPRTSR